MRTRMGVILCVGGFAVLGNVGVAFANHIEPVTAKKFVTSLVTAYTECDPTGATSSHLGLPACSDPQPMNPDCTFGPNGSGWARARVITPEVHDIKITASLLGLSDGCEGDTLEGFATFRVTLNDCDNNLPCTLLDLTLSIGRCTVEGNSCRLEGSINDSLSGLLSTGKMTGVEIVDCVVRGPNADNSEILPTFSCGLLVP